MAEYIERQKAIKLLRKEAVNLQREFDVSGGEACIFSDAYFDAADLLKGIPTADVAPVVHGKWDDSIDGITPYCTVCGRSHRMMQRTPNYCPNCGARMDGGIDCEV